VLRGEHAAGGRVYFKAVFPVFHHEPAVTEALAREHPRALPELLAVDRERGWMLMHELHGLRPFEVPSRRWAPALRAMGEIQRAWVGRRDELLALGAQDRGLASLADEVAGADELAAAVERLEAVGLPETVGHGDLHGGNTAVDQSGRAVVFDWSDAFVGHPLLDLAHFLHQVEDEQVRRALTDAWAEGWGEPLPERALELAAPVSCLHQSVSYRAIAACVEPDDRWLFAAEPERWLEDAYRLARGNASQPG
jgi:Phosphotransferase enzyme family